jgi:hypothetical protein
MAYLSEPRPYSRHPLHKENPKLKANGLPLGTETLVQKPLSKNEMQNMKKNGLPLGTETLVQKPLSKNEMQNLKKNGLPLGAETLL